MGTRVVLALLQLWPDSSPVGLAEIAGFGLDGVLPQCLAVSIVTLSNNVFPELKSAVDEVDVGEAL